MGQVSAGLLLFRRPLGALEVLLAHPGGPYFAGKDLGAWGVPKGVVGEGEALLAAALREFHEETGLQPTGTPRPLGSVKQGSGKVVHAWAVEGDCDPAALHSNTFELEWPRGSGVKKTFPEIDRCGWFTLEQARAKVLAAQRPFLDRLVELNSVPGHSA